MTSPKKKKKKRVLSFADLSILVASLLVGFRLLSTFGHRSFEKDGFSRFRMSHRKAT